MVWIGVGCAWGFSLGVENPPSNRRHAFFCVVVMLLTKICILKSSQRSAPEWERGSLARRAPTPLPVMATTFTKRAKKQGISALSLSLSYNRPSKKQEETNGNFHVVCICSTQHAAEKRQSGSYGKRCGAVRVRYNLVWGVFRVKL